MKSYIVKGYRSAVGKAKKGGFKNMRSEDLAVRVIKHLMSTVPELDPSRIDDVIVGCAMPEGEQGLNMGRNISARALITREMADEFSVRSHANAEVAIDNGYFKDQIVPIEVEEIFVKDGKRVEMKHTVDMDEGLRRGTSMEGLGRLRAVFKNGGIVTAGNSSQTSDAAAFVIVMSEEMVKELGLEPEARLMSCAVGGVEPLYMGIGPCVAIPKALKQAGLKLDDIDLIELNEAFASQSLAVIDQAGIDIEKTNVNGGAIALGHPLGCTGAKLSIQLIHEMRRRGNKYGMVTACVGGGQGIAGVYELLK